MRDSILLPHSPAPTKPADSAWRREPSRVADKSSVKSTRHKQERRRQQWDTRPGSAYPAATSSLERVRDKCAKAAGAAVHRADGDGIRAGNFRSSPAAVAHIALTEAASRFRYRQTRPFLRPYETGFFRNS